MKRITVALVIGDDSWPSQRALRGIKAAMVNAAVEKATLNDLSIVSIEAKIGHVRKVSA
jgi:predicted alpha/beta hydrolase